MQFSSDFRYIQRGAIIKHRINELSVNEYPFDGKWIVQWIRSKSDMRSDIDFTNGGQITVVCNKFTFNDISYRLCFETEEGSEERNSDERINPTVYFDWPIPRNIPSIRQVVESGVNLKQNPLGPDVGSVVVWTVNHRDYHRIFWVSSLYTTYEQKCFL